MALCDEHANRHVIYMDQSDTLMLMHICWSAGSARGLAYLHETTQPPVIHCDFKSTNVLIDLYDQAHVADFGLARHIGGYRPPTVSDGGIICLWRLPVQ